MYFLKCHLLTTRTIAAGQPLAGSFALSYDIENRLTEVKKDNAIIASFVYDGEGKRVKSTINGVTTVTSAVSQMTGLAFYPVI